MGLAQGSMSSPRKEHRPKEPCGTLPAPGATASRFRFTELFCTIDEFLKM